MGYVATKGGERAIEQASEVLRLLRTAGVLEGEAPLSLGAVEHQLHFLHSAVVSEGGLYSPELAALAIKQSLGDPLEAAFYLRAFRSTRERLTQTSPLATGSMRVIRRVSAAFKEVPGGQMLGGTADYARRLFDLDLIDETPQRFRQLFHTWMADLPDAQVPTRLPKVLDYLREQGLIQERPASPTPPFDITREPLVFPLPRSAALATLSRGQQGSMLGIAYSNMRGFGNVHPTVAELRVGYLPVELPDPVTGEPTEVGEVLMTECEVIGDFEHLPDEQAPRFTLGYGACFGHNEIKAVCMAVLDRAMEQGKAHGVRNPSEDQEFVLQHIDGVASMGFCTHWKLPHYVDFQSKLDRLEAVRQGKAAHLAKDATHQGGDA